MIEQTAGHTNRLAQEKSPYLLQHAHNPVDWYPWGEEAFEKAKKEDRPIFLSIGYATCHWCHVMERESFENDEIARLLNENFVSIKVDREERPDIDQIYMTAVQAMTGGGGWPLSAFLTHDLEPFVMGTYFPPEERWGKPGFKTVLLEIAKIWRERRKDVADTGRQIREALQKSQGDETGGEVSVETLRRAYGSFSEMYDASEGGFGAAPKFPRGETLSLLLRIYRRTGEKHALAMATRTLAQMARGGIYDHPGGGFHRYSTDAKWLVPHFEKMLYDNALLAKTYLEMYQVDRNPMWASVAREIFAYVLREMTSPEGGYYSAQDADSEGVEGKCYVWTEEELKGFLSPDEFQKVKEVFRISPSGNFEGFNILNMPESIPWSVRYEAPLATALKKMLERREKRVPPLKDDKIIASWNGLMIGAFAFGARVLDDKKYLEAAKRAANFVLRTMWDGKNLVRRYRDGEARFNASLDDYAFLVQGLLDLYEADFDARWFEAAVGLQARIDDLFWDAKEGGYFFTDTTDASLLTRMKEVYDGAVPSGNSIAVLNLLRLYAFTLNEEYRKKSKQVFAAFGGFVSRNPHASPALLMAVDFATDSSREIVVAGHRDNPGDDPTVRDVLKRLASIFSPNQVLAISNGGPIPLLQGKTSQDGRPTIYICQGHACQKPVHSWEEAETLLLKNPSNYRLY